VRVLLDENLPHGLRALLAGHEVFTVAYLGWIGVRNGEPLAAAERERFDLLITSDQGFPHQQNMEGRKLGVLLLPTPDWNTVKVNVPQIEAAIRSSSPGIFVRVSFDPLE